MILLGLAGYAGSGKDTVADYLVKRYGFLKFSFSDALYREVTEAFDLPHDSILRNRATKEIPTDHLALDLCADKDFVELCLDRAFGVRPLVHDDRQPLSPRQILQWWGTEYRRAQNPNYWIEQADQWIVDVWQSCMYPEHRPQLFVNTSVRFPNERAWVHKFTNGQVWHLRRAGFDPVNTHTSETPLPVLHNDSVDLGGGQMKVVYERELHNNDTQARLYGGIELLLSRQVKFVKVEPMLSEADPELAAGEPIETQTFGPLKE